MSTVIAQLERTNAWHRTTTTQCRFDSPCTKPRPRSAPTAGKASGPEAIIERGRCLDRGRYHLSQPRIGASTKPWAVQHCLSNFTFLSSACRPEELPDSCGAAGLPHALAITDKCSRAGIVRAHIEAKKAGVRLVVGASFRLQNADGSPALSFVALARNRASSKAQHRNQNGGFVILLKQDEVNSDGKCTLRPLEWKLIRGVQWGLQS